MHHNSADTKSRLGALLTSRGVIDESQLSKALIYQQNHGVKLGTALQQLDFVSAKQIQNTLKKQKILRVLASSLVIACSPINSTLANTLESKNKSLEKVRNLPVSGDILAKSHFTSNLHISEIEFEEKSKEFYFSGSHEHLFSLNRDFSDKTGIQFSFFSVKQSNYQEPYWYEFEPQISLYSTASKAVKSNYSPKKIGQGLDRSKNTIPVVFMLTLKGRSLYENSGNQTKMWSLDRAKKGVQRKAELMFSITKQF